MTLNEIMNLKEKIRHQIQYQVDEFVQKTGIPLEDIELSIDNSIVVGDDHFKKSKDIRSLVNFIIKL